MTTEYFLYRKGETVGPMSAETIVQLVQRRQIGLDDLLAEAGCDWRPVSEIVDPELWDKPQTTMPGASVRVGMHQKRTEFLGLGTAIQAVGLVCCFIAFPVGLFAGIVLLLVGSRLSRKWHCSLCQTRLSDGGGIQCPGCSAQLRK